MSDVDQAPVDVSFDEAAAEVGATDGGFHSYTGEDGNTTSWKNPDELNQWIKKSGMFEADYTRKSQARETEYRDNMAKVEKDRADFDKQRTDWEKNEKAKYDRYNEALQKRPAIAQQLQRLVNTPASPDEAFQRSQGYADQKYDEIAKRLDAFDEDKKQAELEKQTEAIYDELGKQYQGFDRETVKAALNSLDGNDPRALIDMIWRSSQYDPAGMQERVEQNIAKKAGSGMLPTGGGSPPVKKSGSNDPKAVNEEAQAWANS